MTNAYDLVAEARAKFGELTAAEERLLRCAESGDIAYCGPSDKDDDPGNDPANADAWGKERTIRAKLIRWLCIDSEANKHIDPRGIQLHAATIGDQSQEKDLDLSEATVNFSLSFGLCKLEVPLCLMGAATRGLYLVGTHIEELQADRLSAGGSIYLREGFHAAREVSLIGASVGGGFDCGGGTFANEGEYALNADGIKVAGDLCLRGKFRAASEISFLGADIGGNLDCSDGTFAINGQNVDALSADGIKVRGDVSFENSTVTGNIRLCGADVGGQLQVSATKFSNGSTFDLQNATIKREFFWEGIGPDTPARLDLRNASVGQILDDDKGWPVNANLFLDGFLYDRIDTEPTSAEGRLRWLARQPDGFTPQPYRQLAKILRERGDDAGARTVLIAMEDSRLKHGDLSAVQRAVRWVLWATVGYGYVPLRALWYIVSFVILGTILFGWGHSAGVVTRVAIKDPSPQVEPFNPFIYSLENFLPLVDLHMAKHWMPDPNATPTPVLWPILDSEAPALGSLGRILRCYLWVHILCGWFFTSMFIAGITGLVRRE